MVNLRKLRLSNTRSSFTPCDWGEDDGVKVGDGVAGGAGVWPCTRADVACGVVLGDGTWVAGLPQATAKANVMMAVTSARGFLGVEMLIGEYFTRLGHWH